MFYTQEAQFSQNYFRNCIFHKITINIITLYLVSDAVYYKYASTKVYFVTSNSYVIRFKYLNSIVIIAFCNNKEG